MAQNMGKWPSGHRKTEKSSRRLAAEKTPFPWRWYGGMSSANLEVIWEMSDELGEDAPSRRSILPANQDPTADARSPLRRQNSRPEPGAFAAHAGICAGGAAQPASLP